jgi:hypothetical protein
MTEVNQSIRQQEKSFIEAVKSLIPSEKFIGIELEKAKEVNTQENNDFKCALCHWLVYQTRVCQGCGVLYHSDCLQRHTQDPLIEHKCPKCSQAL